MAAPIPKHQAWRRAARLSEEPGDWGPLSVRNRPTFTAANNVARAPDGLVLGRTLVSRVRLRRECPAGSFQGGSCCPQ